MNVAGSVAILTGRVQAYDLLNEETQAITELIH